MLSIWTSAKFGFLVKSSSLSVNPLPDMQIVSSSNSPASKDVVSKEWINEDSIIIMSRKHCGKRRDCSL